MLRSIAPRIAAPLACAALATFAPSREARANGRFPAANQLVASPKDPSFLALRTTFGMLFTHDAGGSWDWICEKGIGYGGEEDPSLAMTQTSVIAGTFEGLARSPDDGCSWGFALRDQVVDVVVRRDDPRRALALTSKYFDSGDAGESLFTSKVWSTSDDGATWTQQGADLDPEVLAETVDVAATDPHRIYVSGVRSQPTADGGLAPVGALLVSTDDGAHWTPHDIALDPATERAPFIAAVDPTNADRLYVRVKGTNGSRLLVTDDAGTTFRTVLTAKGDLLGFALSEDGAKVFVGGPVDGLLVASKTDLAFTKKASIQVQCLARVGATLYACSNEASGFIIGASTDDGATFAPKLHLSCIRGPLACPASASTAQCAADFPALQAQLGPGQCVDGGVVPIPADASPDAAAAAPPSSPSSSGCSCDLASPAAAAAPLTALAALLALALTRRRPGKKG